jgi:hypothetical protein
VISIYNHNSRGPSITVPYLDVAEQTGLCGAVRPDVAPCQKLAIDEQLGEKVCVLMPAGAETEHSAAV